MYSQGYYDPPVRAVVPKLVCTIKSAGDLSKLQNPGHTQTN